MYMIAIQLPNTLFVSFWSHLTIRQSDGYILERVIGVIEKKRRVITLTCIKQLKVQMLGGCPTRPTSQTYHLASLYLLSNFHQIFRLVRIKCFQAIRMFDIKTVPNDKILAAFDGEVTRSEPYYGYGNCIRIKHVRT